VTYSHLGPISHRFRNTATYNLKISIENCGQIAADRNIVTTDNLIGSHQRLIRWCFRRPLGLTV